MAAADTNGDNVIQYNEFLPAMVEILQRTKVCIYAMHAAIWLSQIGEMLITKWEWAFFSMQG